MCVAKTHAQFTTVTCLEWKNAIQEDRFKDVIIESLQFLSKRERVVVMAFVIMHNHFHLIWQMLGDFMLSDVRRDFLKYTSQRIIFMLKQEGSPMLQELYVNAADREYQLWERNSLSISLTNESYLLQKLNYIHRNPVKAGLSIYPEDYRYSSAAFYLCGRRDWDFLVHYKG